MKGHGAKFGRKKEEAVAALLLQRNIEEAARAIGVTPSTLLRWQKIPEFRDEYRRARREVVTQSVARLQQATGFATSAILKLMSDPNVPPAVRLRAAELVHALSNKGIEMEDILERLEVLEKAAAGKQRPVRYRDACNGTRPVGL
jgi:DNA-binding transcriptional MerR regulator